jgi:hypothetical protein
MPLTYIIDRVQQRMITHADGLITFDDVSNHLDAEERDRGLDLPELIDATNATTDLTSDQVRRLVRRAADTTQRISLGPTAIVAKQNVVYGMARMYSILMEGIGAPVEVFRDVHSALKWLREIHG